MPVLGFGTSEFPAFYADRSGLRLEHRADTPELAAEALQVQRDRLGLPQAIVLAVPPPPEVALERDEVDSGQSWPRRPRRDGRVSPGGR